MRNYKTIFIILAFCSFCLITAYADKSDDVIGQEKLDREQGTIVGELEKLLKTEDFETSPDEKGSDSSFAYKLAASFFFGLVGFSCFIYGKKTSKATPMLIGVVLMIYPYFVTSLLLLCSIGVALIIALFVAHRCDIGF